MSETNETVTTHETIGPYKGIVHWEGILAATFPSEADRKGIVARFYDAMRYFDTLVFRWHHTAFGGKDITWSSTRNVETDELEIDAKLDDLSWLPEGYLEFANWLDATYNKAGAPPLSAGDDPEEDFRIWKIAKEAAR